MAEPEILDALIPVVKLLEHLDVPYFVTGSLASSAHGIARATLDADVVARLRSEHVESLVSGLEGDYYVDSERVREAVLRRGSFNLIHLGTMLKIDIFIPQERALEEVAMTRIREEVMVGEMEQASFYLASPEDLILFKLDWYRAGGEVSERQWQDVLGILKMQQGRLDWTYLEKWASELGVAGLLAEASRETQI